MLVMVEMYTELVSSLHEETYPYQDAYNSTSAFESPGVSFTR